MFSVLKRENCIFCKQKSREKLVQNPEDQSIRKISDLVSEFAALKDEDCQTFLTHMKGDVSVENLKSNNCSWHLSCYKRFTHKSHKQKVIKRFEKSVEDETFLESVVTEPSILEASGSSSFTRSKTMKYVKTQCFFCDEKGTKIYSLHAISYDRSGASLKQAVDLSNNDIWRVRLSECISETDAHAVDVMYHLKCWNKNVRNVLCRKKQLEDRDSRDNAAIIASEIEFINLVEECLEGQIVTTIVDLHSAYLNICISNGLDPNRDDLMSRRKLKDFLKEEILGIEFSFPKQKRESERVSLKTTKDSALIRLEEDINEDGLRSLFKAASVIRKLVTSSKKWEFKGSLEVDDKTIPKELLLFFKWCMVGKATLSSDSHRGSEIDQRSIRLAQSLIFETLTPRQATLDDTKVIRRNREMPLQLGVALTIRRETRSAKLVDFLSQMGMGVSYSRLHDVETLIAKEVLSRMNKHDGVYIPPDFVKGRKITFAFDNFDFQEDTPDGQRTMHGTVMVLYQRIKENDIAEVLSFSEDYKSLEIPSSIFELLPCEISKSARPRSPIYPQYKLEDGVSKNMERAFYNDLIWILSRLHGLKEVEGTRKTGLTWSAHNSLIYDSKEIFRSWFFSNRKISTADGYEKL